MHQRTIWRFRSCARSSFDDGSLSNSRLTFTLKPGIDTLQRLGLGWESKRFVLSGTIPSTKSMKRGNIVFVVIAYLLVATSLNAVDGSSSSHPALAERCRPSTRMRMIPSSFLPFSTTRSVKRNHPFLHCDSSRQQKTPPKRTESCAGDWLLFSLRGGSMNPTPETEFPSQPHWIGVSTTGGNMTAGATTSGMLHPPGSPQPPPPQHSTLHSSLLSLSTRPTSTRLSTLLYYWSLVSGGVAFATFGHVARSFLALVQWASSNTWIPRSEEDVQLQTNVVVRSTCAIVDSSLSKSHRRKW